MANLTGKVVRVLPVISGENEKGAWQRIAFVILTDGEQQHQVAFTAFGERRVSQVQSLKVGQSVVVTYYLESREFALRYYTEAYMTDVLVARPIREEGGRNE